MYKLSLNDFDRAMQLLVDSYDVFLPVDSGTGCSYRSWEPGLIPGNSLNTVRSAKDFFFPQTEDLVAFKLDGKNVEPRDVRAEVKDFVIFGVRACDLKSFDILDRVFLADPVDTYYKNRRDHSVVIAYACSSPSQTCFCSAFGIDPTSPRSDCTMWRVADDLYFDFSSDKGMRLYALMESVLTECSDDPVKQQQHETLSVLERLPLHDLHVPDLRDKLMDTFESPVWDELYKSCLGCGSCTFVCPTCQCFDIRDYDTGHGVIRYRCWDSCMYSDFTKMAAADPRLTQKERFRQRFMHKLVYYPQNNDGIYSCVGCGRCLRKCPVNMNIVKVIKKLGGDENA